ncbi:uncharacterized protein A4U43_C01F17600 [Asparagus officinalis]|uniref:RanBP2-type domain-containing protein n=1 Tax=Asparagus officinalis TaxID=4686 RepID=A0A5P1FQ43_ASPOF|nr:uncharacterized protein LOC109834884 [Asparagus officinalis]ONK80426.1 uncharacterized protein A4U43_C01F17600 [Asparagus officinalis]
MTSAAGYLPRAGSISPPLRRPRLDGSHYDTNFDYPAGSRFGRGFRGGGRGGGRFRDVSPPNGLGRGGRSSYGRGYTVDQRVLSPDGEYVHRNDPNLSPREGDWICGNPRCGNLNFARRTYCNNCDEPRYATTGRPTPIRSPVRTGPIRSPLRTGPIRSPLRTGPIRSPRRPYFTSPPSRRSPPDITAPPLDRALRRNFNGYQSPPRGRYRDDRIEYEEEYRGGRNNWLMDEEWERRRGYDRRPLSPLSPRDGVGMMICLVGEGGGIDGCWAGGGAVVICTRGFEERKRGKI